MPPICSYRPDGELVVCCADCKLDDTEEMKGLTVLPRGYFHKKVKSIAWTKCVEYYRELPYSCRGDSSFKLDKRWQEDGKCDELHLWHLPSFVASGGENAHRNQFPHMALLGYGPSVESAQWYCGGTVISNRFILTAAHCCSTDLLGPITYAGLGLLTRDDLSDYYKVYKIISIIMHPKYKSPSKYHDIALIKTQTEINFGPSLLPACLDVRGKFTEPWAHATGWGRLAHRGQLADHLQVVHLDMYEDRECSDLFPPHRHLTEGYDNNTQMCFGKQDKIVDTCMGDSGGPLHSYLHSCICVIFGVTSFGKDCGTLGKPGMYTRVSHYVPWIESIVWPDQ